MKSYKNDQIYVEKFQECHFLGIKKTTPNDAGGGGHWGKRVLLIALLIGYESYSYPLLIPLTHSSYS